MRRDIALASASERPSTCTARNAAGATWGGGGVTAHRASERRALSVACSWRAEPTTVMRGAAIS